MTTQLKCEHCNKIFEISNKIADAMTRWRDASGEPLTCGECAGTLEEIDTQTTTVARNVVEGGGNSE